MKAESWRKLPAQLLLVFIFAGLDRGVAVAQEARPNSALSTNAGAVTARSSSSNDLASEPVQAGVGWAPGAGFAGGLTGGIGSGGGRGGAAVRLYSPPVPC